MKNFLSLMRINTTKLETEMKPQEIYVTATSNNEFYGKNKFSLSGVEKSFKSNFLGRQHENLSWKAFENFSCGSGGVYC